MPSGPYRAHSGMAGTVGMRIPVAGATMPCRAGSCSLAAHVLADDSAGRRDGHRDVVPDDAAFGWYVTRFANYSEVYGSLGAGIALLFWLYIVSLSVLCGAEFNAQFDASSREFAPRRSSVQQAPAQPIRSAQHRTAVLSESDSAKFPHGS